MTLIEPSTDCELKDALVSAAMAGGAIRLGGAFSKDRMNASSRDAAVTISTRRMTRVLQYDPADLTISVEAGLRWTHLVSLLSERRQMIPLDPPGAEDATVGGVIATNGSGPRRRLYGTARDCVIGMTFATLDGKLAKSGGMVVKNVAGLDIAKLMIGSFGTLAGIAVVNFKLSPMPPETRTFALQFATAQESIGARDRILRGPLLPASIDLLNPAAARMAGFDGYMLLIQAGGDSPVLGRYQKELEGAVILSGDDEARLWRTIRDFTPAFVGAHDAAHVARISCTLKRVGEVAAETDAPLVVRAGSGVCRAHFESAAAAAAWREHANRRGWKYVFEYGNTASNGVFGSDFVIMEKVKDLFDPRRLLNPGRLYGRI
jgi:glycolate oxidase FAD binding subunit